MPEVFKFQQVFQLIKSNAYEGEVRRRIGSLAHVILASLPVCSLTRSHRSHLSQLRVHPTGMAFRNTKTSKVIQVHTPEMAKARWMRVARGNQVG